MEMKPIEGYEDRYAITDTGEVFSIPRQKYLTQRVDKDGYKYVRLRKVGTKQKFKRIHRLVAEAFLENPNNYTSINHIDENKQNNNVDNLEWCSVQYNTQYSSYKNKGKSFQQKKVVCIDELHNKISIYPNIGTTRHDGFTPSSVRYCCKGIYKTHKGCKFMYYDDWIRGDAQ